MQSYGACIYTYIHLFVVRDYSVVLLTMSRYLMRSGFFDKIRSTAATFPSCDADSRFSPYVHINKIVAQWR